MFLNLIPVNTTYVHKMSQYNLNNSWAIRFHLALPHAPWTSVGCSKNNRIVKIPIPAFSILKYICLLSRTRPVRDVKTE